MSFAVNEPSTESVPAPVATTLMPLPRLTVSLPAPLVTLCVPVAPRLMVLPPSPAVMASASVLAVKVVAVLSMVTSSNSVIVARVMFTVPPPVMASVSETPPEPPRVSPT